MHNETFSSAIPGTSTNKRRVRFSNRVTVIDIPNVPKKFFLSRLFHKKTNKVQPTQQMFLSKEYSIPLNDVPKSDVPKSSNLQPQCVEAQTWCCGMFRRKGNKVSPGISY